jgi:hypothetical protein
MVVLRELSLRALEVEIWLASTRSRREGNYDFGGGLELDFV